MPIYTSNGEYPGKKLKGEERYKKLYHYTSFDSFVKIWLSKTLKFSPLPNVNDIQEAETSFSVYHPAWTPVLAAYKDIRLSYKQISFTMDYDTYFKGCMSPMMWGLYADKRKGVCIEIDYEKLALPEACMAHSIIYKPVLKKKQQIAANVHTIMQVRNYIKKNKLSIFFTKHKCWKEENEFRIVSNQDDFLDIREAISAVYLTSCSSPECILVEQLVGDSVPVKYIYYRDACGNIALPELHDTHSSRLENEQAINNPQNILNRWAQNGNEIYEQHKDDENFPLHMNLLR